MNKTLKILSIVAIAVVIIVGFSINNSEKKGELNIGVISALTGNVAFLGNSNMKGTEVGKIKAQSEYPKLAINLYQEDHMFSPKVGIDAYNKLRQSNNISALVTMASNVSVAVAPLSIKDNVLDIAASTLAKDYSTPNDLTFRLTPRAENESSIAIQTLSQKGVKKLGILYMNNEIGTSLRDALVESAKTSDVKIITEEGYAPDSTDFKTPLLKMKSADIDGLYLAALSPHTAIILKQANELKIKVVFFSYRAAEDPVLVQNAGVLAEGLLYTSAYDINSNSAENTEFIKLFKEKYNEVPNGYAAEAYEAVRLIVDSFNKCGSTVESEQAIACTKNYLFSIKNRPSVFGPLSFNINGDVEYPFIVKTIKDGKFVKVD
jgi:branched-chain amino acid transport system substrate-binding protein